MKKNEVIETPKRLVKDEVVMIGTDIKDVYNFLVYINGFDNKLHMTINFYNYEDWLIDIFYTGFEDDIVVCNTIEEFNKLKIEEIKEIAKKVWKKSQER